MSGGAWGGQAGPVCPSCGRANPAGAVYCKWCGQPTNPPVAARPAGPLSVAPRTVGLLRGRNLAVVLAVAVAVIVVLAALAFRPSPSQAPSSTASAIVDRLQITDPAIKQDFLHALQQLPEQRRQAILGGLNQLTPAELAAGRALLNGGVTGLNSDQAAAAIDDLFGVATQDERAALTAVANQQLAAQSQLVTDAVYGFPRDWTTRSTMGLSQRPPEALADTSANLQTCLLSLYSVLQGMVDATPACTSPMDPSLRVELQPAITNAIEYIQGLENKALQKVDRGNLLFLNAITQGLRKVDPGDVAFLYLILSPPAPQNLVNLFYQVLNSCGYSPLSCTIGQQQLLAIAFLGPQEQVPPLIQQDLLDCILGLCSADESQALEQYTNHLRQDYRARQQVIDEVQASMRESAQKWWEALGRGSGASQTLGQLLGSSGRPYFGTIAALWAPPAAWSLTILQGQSPGMKQEAWGWA